MTRNSRVREAVERVERELTRAARSRQIPDYVTFQDFMISRFERERDAGLLAVHPEIGPYSAAAAHLLSHYHKRYTSGRCTPMDFRRYKLLRSLYADNGRAQQMAESILDQSNPADPTLEADDATPATLRRRLLAAIEHGAYEDANFLLGLLDEADHDPGERAYLRALASYEAGNLRRTITLVESVPPDGIDRSRAAWLAAKASALLGDQSALERILAEVADRLTPCAWLHLIELLDPSCRTREFSAFLTTRLPSPLKVRPSDPAYAEWAMLHVQTMARDIARSHEIVEASIALGEMPSEASIAKDAVLASTAAALFIERQIGGNGRAREVARRLDPVIAEGSLRAFRVALELLFEAQDHAAIIALARQFPSGANLPWQDDFDTVGVVYCAALLTGDRLAQKLRRIVEPTQLQPVEGAARRISIANRLTLMGRISFLTAASELDRARNRGDVWRDCGLIALALFRALEVELNARLVRPLAGRLDIQALRSQLPTDERALRVSLKELAGASSGSNGLMLGQLRALLTTIGAVESEDPLIAAVHAELRSGFQSLLSYAGQQVQPLNAMVDMIGAAATGRFRNPPAHGQFLHLDDAAAALQHVETALDELSRWLPNAA